MAFVRVLTERAVWLAEHQLIPPWLILTFTGKEEEPGRGQVRLEGFKQRRILLCDSRWDVLSAGTNVRDVLIFLATCVLDVLCVVLWSNTFITVLALFECVYSL